MPHKTIPQKPPRRSRWIRRAITAAGVILIVLLLVPYVISSDLLRDRVLGAAVDDASLEVSSRSGSFGWVTPVRVNDLTVRSPDRGLVVEVAQLRSDRPWWQLWWSPDRIGHVDLIAPSARVNLDWQQFDGYAAGGVPQFSAALDDASLLVELERMSEPVIDLNAFDLALRVEEAEDGAYLIIDDAVVLNNRQITAETCRELLQLIDPALGDVVQAEGEFTLHIERLRLPLNADAQQQQRPMNLAGRLELHRVTTAATTPLLRGVVRVAADMHDMPPSEIVRVVNQSDVNFEIRDGRLYHTGLRFGLPDVDPELVVRSQGSVGLDESLDLNLSIPKLFLNEQPAGDSTSNQVAKLHITGTIQEPVITRLDAPQEDIQDEVSLR